MRKRRSEATTSSILYSEADLMETLAMLASMFAMIYSLSLTADIYHLAQYTSLCSKRKQIRLTMYAQGAVVFWLAGTLVYRHSHILYHSTW